MPVLLPSFLGRKSRATSRREMLSPVRLDDQLMRDIRLRPTDLYAIPAKRPGPACGTGATRRWAEFVSRLRHVFPPEPTACCQS